MKKFILLFVFAFSFLSACTSDETTTYYLIRHSEKDRNKVLERDPNLNKKGLERAKRWAEYFKNIDLDAVYSTNYKRTMQTATPTAESKKLEVKIYSPRRMYDSIFQKETKGKSVLVVGHSNTTPFFVNEILGEKKYKDMSDRDNASLYIVTVTGGKKTSKIKKVK